MNEKEATHQMGKLSFKGTIKSIQPRIRLTRSFEETSHSYLGYAVKIAGTIDVDEGDFSIANKLLKVDFIDYQKLQNLMLGKVFVDLNPTDYTATFANNQYTITYNKNQAISTSPKEGEYIQTYVFDNGFRLKEAHLKDPKRKMEVDLAYDNWVKAGAEEFPKNVKIIIKEKKTRQIDLEYNSFTFQETNTPFSIPDGYKKKEIK